MCLIGLTNSLGECNTILSAFVKVPRIVLESPIKSFLVHCTLDDSIVDPGILEFEP